MRKILFFSILIGVMGCKPKKSPGVNELAISDTKYISNPSDIQMLDTMVDLGQMNEGDRKKVVFRFKNIGKSDLVIMEVKPSCGCTIADYPKQPFKPGETGEITAEFNSKGKQGLFRKHIEIFSTTIPTSHIVFFKGEIVVKN